ncbi:MAG: molybdopterin-dependent oxidoreductase [Deltaproteobacteria bacterium]|nr:molybdopterin-dependent oxidoreductase [Deltaproteobacteria bacterium]
MALETKKTFCRMCSAYCALDVDVEDEQVVAVRGDKSDSATGGYTCIKGRQVGHQLHGPQRLRSCLKRQADGSYEPISSEQAMDEIAERLGGLMEAHGPDAVGSYQGTAGFFNSATHAMLHAWHKGIGSSSVYSTMTIDQPSKIIAVARHGLWGGGGHTFASADVALSIGNNPVISGLTLPGGIPGFNPVKRLNDAKKRGLELIVIDPRRSESARRADLHLQIRPGEDPTLLAGMLRVILDEGLHDVEFCNEHVEGIDELRAAIADFTPDYVERRAGVPAEQMIEAARLFAAGPRGSASSGTGPDMAPHPSLTEHLISCLNTVCGRHNREGEALTNPGVFTPPLPRTAQPIAPALLPPFFGFGKGRKSRFRGLYQLFEEMPTATLAEEILEPGEGQIRALMVVGGNPAVAAPDSCNMIRALESLDLLVCIDIAMSATARRADYVIAARHPFEREDATDFTDPFYEEPYAFYTHKVVEPDFDVLEDWELFIGLAKRLGSEIELAGGAIDTGAGATKLEVLKRIRPETRVSYDEVRAKSGGHVYEDQVLEVAPPIPGIEARLQCAPEGICEELREVRGEPIAAEQEGAFTHLLICRRLRHFQNSVGQDFPQSQEQGGTTNSAYMNAVDLEELGIGSGDLISIESDQDRIVAVAEATDEVRSGVVSMSHCWGDGDLEDGDVRKSGSNTSRLVATDRDYDAITGMARQTAIPVAVRPA